MEIVLRMREKDIPQDTQWNDIDYMSTYLDFTYNHTSFKQLPQLVKDLHTNGQHYVVITVSIIIIIITPLRRTPLGQLKVSLQKRCPHFKDSFVH